LRKIGPTAGHSLRQPDSSVFRHRGLRSALSPPAAVATRQALHRSGTAAASEPAPHLVPHADNELKTLHEIAVFNNI